MSKLNILLLTDHVGYGRQLHGVGVLLKLWARHLDPSRFNVTVCAIRNQSQFAETYRSEGIRFIDLKRSAFNPLALSDLATIVTREKIDVIHAQQYGAITLAGLLKKRTGVSVLVHFHDRHSHYPFIQKIADRLLIRHADAYVAVSESVRKCWGKRCALDEAKMHVLFNCVDTKRFSARPDARIHAEKERLGLALESPVVGTVTRLFETKGTEFLIQALPAVLAEVPSCQVVIVGDGPLRGELEKKAKALGVSGHIHFVGSCSDVAPVLSTFDVQVLTSYQEAGSPLPVTEAMAMAKPTIATDVVETIVDGETGLLVPRKDAKRLADTIIFLLKNPERAAQLGRRAATAAANLDVRLYVKKLGALYYSVRNPS